MFNLSNFSEIVANFQNISPQEANQLVEKQDGLFSSSAALLVRTAKGSHQN